MDRSQSNSSIHRRRFLAAAGALAAAAALPAGTALAGKAQTGAAALPPDFDGTIAAWVRWTPERTARIVLGARARGDAMFIPVAQSDVPAIDCAAAPAVAREFAVQQVARAWSVDPSSCRLADGILTHDASGRRAGAVVWLSVEAA